MGYSNDPSMVEVHFFKPQGKYYTTEAVKWLSSDSWIIDEFKYSLRNHLQDGRLSEMWALCMEPYHEHSHPLMLRDWND